MAKSSHKRTKTQEPVAQAALFTSDQLPERHELIQYVPSFEHNGKTTCKDEELCFAVIEYLIQGHSKRETARHFHMGRHTIAAMVAELERTGKMAPLKKRLAVKFGQVVEGLADHLLERIEDGDLPDNVVGITLAQTTDKLLLLQGDPTVIVEERHVGPSIDDINRWAETIDVPSEPVGRQEESSKYAELPAPGQPIEPAQALESIKEGSR